jgi:hypothetical protein
MHLDLLFFWPECCLSRVEETVLLNLCSEPKYSSSSNFQDANRIMTEENAQNQTADQKNTLRF